jgi:hypothetical protein
MEAVVERGNMLIAYQRVMKNKGAAGVDGLTVEELKPFRNYSAPPCIPRRGTS